MRPRVLKAPIKRSSLIVYEAGIFNCFRQSSSGSQSRFVRPSVGSKKTSCPNRVFYGYAQIARRGCIAPALQLS